MDFDPTDPLDELEDFLETDPLDYYGQDKKIEDPKPYHPPKERPIQSSLEGPPGFGYAPPSKKSPHTGLDPIRNPYAHHHPWKVKNPGRPMGGKSSSSPRFGQQIDQQFGQSGLRFTTGDYRIACPLHGEVWRRRDCMMNCEHHELKEPGGEFCKIRKQQQLEELREEEARHEVERAERDREFEESRREQEMKDEEMLVWRREGEEIGYQLAEKERAEYEARKIEEREEDERIAGSGSTVPGANGGVKTVLVQRRMENGDPDHRRYLQVG